MRGNAGKELRDARLFNHLYRAIKSDRHMPGAPDIPGKSTARQAQALRYKDMYKNIQAVREAAFKRQQGRAQFSKEFKGLGAYLGDAAKKAAKTTAPGLLLAAAGVGLYFLWGKKKAEAPKTEAPKALAELDEEPPVDVEEPEVQEGRFYYY